MLRKYLWTNKRRRTIFSTTNIIKPSYHCIIMSSSINQRHLIQTSTSNNVWKAIKRRKKMVPVSYNTLRLGNTYGLTNKDSTIKQVCNMNLLLYIILYNLFIGIIMIPSSHVVCGSSRTL